jgi:hypothetical protein
MLSCSLAPNKEQTGAEHLAPACVPTQEVAALKNREKELRSTAEKLLAAFRGDDTATFLRLIHPDYFSMGEGRNYTLADLKRSFDAREEMYCYLFDASCVPPPAPNDTPETSFSVVAKRPEARVLSAEVWSGDSIAEPGCRGSANFAWADPQNPANNSTFTFMYVDRQWRAVGFDFPPAQPLANKASSKKGTER